MPYVRLPNGDASLHYRLQSASRDGGAIDPTKQTLLLVHGMLWAGVDVCKQFDDPRLRRRFNIIAFDQRSHGRTRAEVSPYFDLFVAAADIALALEALRMPKVHCVALNACATAVALRLALIFPERFYSFILGNVTQVESLANAHALADLSELFFNPSDGEEYLQAVGGALDTMYGTVDGHLTQSDEDLLARRFVARYQPATVRRLFEVIMPYGFRLPLTPEQLGSIKHPCLILRGDKDFLYTKEDAEALRDSLTGAKVAVIETVEGPHCFFYSHPSDFDTAILQFVTEWFPTATSPRPQTTFVLPFASPGSSSNSDGSDRSSEDSIRTDPILDLALCLRRLGEIGGPSRALVLSDEDIDLTTIDNVSALEFSCVSQEAWKANMAQLDALAKREKANAKMLAFGSFWDSESDEEAIPISFKFTARHDFGVGGPRQNRQKA